MRQLHRKARVILLCIALGDGAACSRASSSAAPRLPERERPPASVALLPAETRIRYRAMGADDDLRYDRVARASADTLWLASGRSMPVARLVSVDASYGPRPSGSRLALSMGLGAAAGGILGALVPPDTTIRHRPHSRAETAGLGALLGIIVGTITWVVAAPSERWTAVPLQSRP